MGATTFLLGAKRRKPEANQISPLGKRVKTHIKTKKISAVAFNFALLTST
jgi:hypothetical protein